MDIQVLIDHANSAKQDEMPSLQAQATLALAEQVKRIADLLESVIGEDQAGYKSLYIEVMK